jgi:hypothetical protein
MLRSENRRWFASSIQIMKAENGTLFYAISTLSSPILAICSLKDGRGRSGLQLTPKIKLLLLFIGNVVIAEPVMALKIRAVSSAPTVNKRSSGVHFTEYRGPASKVNTCCSEATVHICIWFAVFPMAILVISGLQSKAVTCHSSSANKPVAFDVKGSQISTPGPSIKLASFVPSGLHFTPFRGVGV